MENSGNESKQCVVPRVGKSAPPFHGKAVVNGSVKKIDLQDFKEKYVILLFCNEDFFISPPSEIIDFIRDYEAFNRVNCAIIACSTESVNSHLAWITIQRKLAGLGNLKIILLSDKNSHISKNYGVYDESTGFCMRALFVIDKTSVLRHITLNDNKVCISVNEAKRIIYEMENIPLPVDLQKQRIEAKDVSLFIPKKHSKELFTANVSPQKQEEQIKVTAEVARGKSSESLFEENRPTELRVSKRETTMQQVQPLSSSDTLNFVNLKTCKVPAHFLNGLRVEIDFTENTKDTFAVYVQNKLKASFVKLTNGDVQILFNEDCYINFGFDKIFIKFATDELIMQVLRRKDEIEITIDEMTVKKKVKDNFAYFSIETSSNKNHILCVNGRAVRLKAMDATTDNEVHDYTEIGKGGNKFIYYRKFKK